MAAHGFLQYVKLKLIVSLVRALNLLLTRPHFKPSPTCRRKRIRVPSRQAGRFIDAWLYLPPDYSEEAEDMDKKEGGKDKKGEEKEKKETKRPVVVNWHGGGYIIPNLGMDHAFCQHLARAANVLVLDADYRKAPENTFPAAVEDAEDVLRWIAARPDLFDADRVALSGFSSGGNLALVAATELRRELVGAGVNVRAVYSFYPGVDFSLAPEARTVPEPIRPLTVYAQHVFADSYTPCHRDRRSPRVSPMFADPLAFPPHVLLVTCSGDVLAPEAEALGEKLRRTGHGVEVVRVEGAAHGFDKTIHPKLYKPEAREMTYSKVVESLKIAM